jgi:hypothetical protein
MNTLQRITIGLFVAPLLGACVGHFAMASRLNDVSIGMSKSRVVAIMGEPENVSAVAGIEDLVYVLNTSAWDTSIPEPYIVRLINGKVQSYGRKADMARTF